MWTRLVNSIGVVAKACWRGGSWMGTVGCSHTAENLDPLLGVLGHWNPSHAMVLVMRGCWPKQLVLVLGLLMAAHAWADPEMPPQLRAVMMLKVLNYDRSLGTRVADTVNVGVLARSVEADPYCSRLMVALQDGATKANLAGKPTRIVALPFTTPADLEARLTREPMGGLFVCPSVEDQVAAIAGITRKRHVLSFSGSDAAVRAGLGVGLFLREQRPVILVNLAVTRAEGADLDAALLRISEVLK